jgi:hypothetical protein
MDGSRFDTLARVLAPAGTRRRLVTLLAVLPLGGVLAVGGEESAAERPLDRVQGRTQQRNTKRRNHSPPQHQHRKQQPPRNQNSILGACEQLYQPCIDSLVALKAEDARNCCFILADCEAAKYNQCLVATGVVCPPA